LILITISVCFKISAVPFHMWTPDVYQGSPTIVTAFFASAPKVVGIGLFIRLMLDPFSVLYEQWMQIIIFISIASMIVGGLAAIAQNNMKRLLAYSSIGHVGFALAGLVSGDTAGIQGLFVYIVIYVTMTLGIFSALLMIKFNGENLETINDFAGLSKTNPTLAMIIAIMMLSMAGIPPFAGFLAKFYVLLPVIKQQLYTLAIIFVIMSVVSAYYYLKIIKVMYFDSSQKENGFAFLNSSSLMFVALLMTIFNVVFIISPSNLLLIGEKVSTILIQ
jgi:NADH-quinone oxidoreductase subunit N